MQKLITDFIKEKEQIKQAKADWASMVFEELKIREIIQDELLKREHKAKEEIK